MAITYKWDIPAMKAHIQAEGEDNVIYSVYYIIPVLKNQEAQLILIHFQELKTSIM